MAQEQVVVGQPQQGFLLVDGGAGGAGGGQSSSINQSRLEDIEN